MCVCGTVGNIFILTKILGYEGCGTRMSVEGVKVLIVSLEGCSKSCTVVYEEY